ncbi:MAG: ANTAR domain-containing protein [Burkholderiales bacterium]|nr:ANTAR domain-containing protein [Burkholderiales bacterium]
MPLRILLLHETHHDLPAVESALHARGDVVRSMAVNALTLHDEISSWNPDLILIASDDAARDVLEQVCVTTQFGARPIVVFTEDDDPEAIRMAIRARVAAYVVAGLSPERLSSVIDVALERFQHDQAQIAALREAERAKQRSESSEAALVRAKSLLRRRGLSEPEAYAWLRREAMRQRVTVAQVAERMVDGALPIRV